MQRVPTRQRQAMPNQRQQGGRQQNNNEASPALLLARRIREEQGVEQLKSFLSAMEPFVAPNELRTISGGFGINFDALMKQASPRGGSGGNSGGGSMQGFGRNGQMPAFGGSMGGMQGFSGNGSMPNFGGGMNGGNQLKMLQMLMNMQGMMKGGKPDMSQLFKMMGGR